MPIGLRTFINRRNLRDGIRNTDLDYNFALLEDNLGGGGGEGPDFTTPVTITGSTDFTEITESNLDIKYGTVLHDGFILNSYTGRISTGFYFVGDSLMSAVSNTIAPQLTWDVNGAGTVGPPTITVAGADLIGDFQFVVRDPSLGVTDPEEAIFQCTVVGGAVTAAVLVTQSAPWAANKVGHTATVLGDTQSWNHKLFARGAFTTDTVHDCLPARAVSNLGTKYKYMAPPATAECHIAVIEIGANDSTKIDIGAGDIAGGGVPTVTEAAWKADYSAIIQNFLDDDYRVVCMLAPYNDIGLGVNESEYDTAISLIRQWTKEAALLKGVDEFIDYHTTNLVDTLHPSDTGQELILRELYPQLVALSRETNPWFTGQILAEGGIEILDVAYSTALNAFGLSAAAIITPSIVVDVNGLAVNGCGIIQTDVLTVDTLMFNNADNTQNYVYKTGSGESISIAGGWVSAAKAPTANAHLANKLYVDSQAGSSDKVLKAGDTMTGVLIATAGARFGSTATAPSTVSSATFEKSIALEGLPPGSGTLYIVSNFGVLGYINSDIRFKKNITPNPYGMKEIMKVTPISYDPTEEQELTHKRVGFSAQNLLTCIPEAAPYIEKDDRLSLDIIPILSTAVNAIQEQQQMLDKLLQRIERLEAKLK